MHAGVRPISVYVGGLIADPSDCASRAAIDAAQIGHGVRCSVSASLLLRYVLLPLLLLLLWDHAHPSGGRLLVPPRPVLR